ncbi:aliphatic sulfonate ABC transporter substrate-binding protein [Pseudomonas entomophila]|uniref:aliphatic sulfonate ABC transporter substrate-binding protein n=1 Tax=Pseudomonas entomophila TaxID=312306 RepID=UPI001F02578C|nr:aliphatic sulfonate ABC transporter substrate-binding protein [Pseudomonas entomophila]MCG8291323.1 aliphatic sulfonate ABC transporter substrate-binding protein [Pseudomonas entomophila]
MSSCRSGLAPRSPALPVPFTASSVSRVKPAPTGMVGDLRFKYILLGLLSLMLGIAHADETLRVSSQKSSLQVLLQAAGELDNVPYPLEFASFGAAAPTAEALAAGAVDIGTLGTAPFVFATSAGVDLKAVGVVRLQVTPTAVAIIVPQGSPLIDGKALVGSRITTTRGSIGHYLALAALRSSGHSGRDATFVFLQPGESRTLLANGGADAWATWDPYTSMAQLEGGTRVLVSGEGLFAGNMLLVANVEAIRDKPRQLRDFLQRVGRAWAWANAHVEQYSAIQARQSGLPLDVHLRSNRYSRPRRVDVDDGLLQDLVDTARLYQDEGVISPGFNAEQRVDRQFNEMNGAQ